MFKVSVHVVVIAFVVAILSVGFTGTSYAQSSCTGFIDDSTPSCWTYSGTWASGTFSGANNNTLHYSRTAGDTATGYVGGVADEGNVLTIGFRGTPDSGKMSIAINGVSLGTVDNYRSSSTYTSVSFTLFGIPNPPSNINDVKITVLNSKNTHSTNYYISIDYVYLH